jgi:signal recognition particle GTPase
MEAIDVFYPVMAERILGMGDVVSLVEEHKNSLMRKKLEKFKRKCQKTNLVLMIFFLKFNR